MSQQQFINHAVTYMPESGVYVDGYHTKMPHSPQLLARASVKEISPEVDSKFGFALDAPTYQMSATPISPQLYAVANTIARNKDRIRLGQLTAADLRIGFEDLNPLVLVRLHNQLMGEQMRWFHLDQMFNNMPLDQLVYRMSFRDNVASAQEVGIREEYDITKVPFEDIDFNLTKIVAGYDIALEDTLRATIDPISPLKQSNDYAMAFARERRAAAALSRLAVFYDRSAADGEDAFVRARGTGGNDDLGQTSAQRKAGTIPTAWTTAAGAAEKRISNPIEMTGGTDAGGVHSKNRVSNEIQIMKNKFMEAYDHQITHVACSPNTAMELAQNTWTAPNTIFNVEAYRTGGGTRPFPGVSETTMVIAQILPDNVLYCTVKPSNVMVKAEGPKINKAWEDNNKFTQLAAQLDFNQYKCAHDELVEEESRVLRPFGFIAVIDSDTVPTKLTRQLGNPPSNT